MPVTEWPGNIPSCLPGISVPHFSQTVFREPCMALCMTECDWWTRYTLTDTSICCICQLDPSFIRQSVQHGQYIYVILLASDG